jgi:hypothetical protein
MADFERLGVCPDLIKAIQSYGWNIPTAVQDEAIPLILGVSKIRKGITQLNKNLLKRPSHVSLCFEVLRREGTFVLQLKQVAEKLELLRFLVLN